MKIYKLERHQFVPITIDQAWDFFSSPKNLKKITPDYLGFEITSGTDNEKMYAGMIITYIVKPLLGIPLRWMTEIKHVNEPNFFVDEQRIGPYKIWHHEHHFKEVDGGVDMTDIVHYAMPFGILGTIAHAITVKRQLNQIFDYRIEAINKEFDLQLQATS